MAQSITTLIKASLASGTIYFAGDVTAQTFIEKNATIDLERSARFTLIGALWAGPFCRLGMGRISGMSSKWYHRVALDQSILMPFNMAIVNCLKPLADGKDTETVLQIWREKYPKVMAFAWMFWLPTAITLYRFAPSENVRFVLFNLAAYVWQVNLASIMNQTKVATTTSDEDASQQEKTTKRPKYTRRVSLLI